MSRLKDIEIFDKKAIDLVSQKVSSYSGDIRRSLQITKRAVEICRDEYLKKCSGETGKLPLIPVSYTHILRAFNELYNSKTCIVLRSLRKFEVLVIFGIYLELIISKQEKVGIDKAQERCDNML